MKKYSMETGGKTVAVYPSDGPDRPVIYLNTSVGESDGIYQALREMGCPDHTLAAVSGLEWNCDLAPWDMPPVFKNDEPCTGGADEYLRLLTEEIIPAVEGRAQGRVPWRGLAGYSLAGLFALYAMYRTDRFARAASMSGSLWFPDFKEYAMTHSPKRMPEHLYLSLGDKEHKTRNAYMKTVRDSTEELADFYRGRQIDTEYRLEPGGHFADAVRRTARGILWLLSK